MSYKQLLKDKEELHLKTKQLATKLSNLMILTNNLINRMEGMRYYNE